MLILVQKDSATVVPREVADDAEAQTFVDRGFTVERMLEDGTKVPFTMAPAAEEAAAEPAKPAAKKAAAKTPAKR
jgi:hypothetical protein